MNIDKVVSYSIIIALILYVLKIIPLKFVEYTLYGIIILVFISSLRRKREE